mmetsp:Transcript_36001/g.53681  ORF Transcript_36001/g.53681 Transcript_36001/m.53681 type:complete len:403 (-) Transcript_36001:822-2030(-)
MQVRPEASKDRMTFPYETYDLIDQCNEEAPLVAAWSGDGLHFILKDKAVFEKDFLTTKYESFIKQLNNYGFTKINSKLEELGRTIPKGEEHFEHVNFRRGQRDMCKDVKRAKILLKKIAEEIYYSRENKRLKSDNSRLIVENSCQADEIKRLAEELKQMKETNRNTNAACEHQGVSHAIDSRSRNGAGASSFPATMARGILPPLSGSSSPPSILLIPGTLKLAPEPVVGSESNREEKTDQIDFDGGSKSFCCDSDLGTAVGDNSTGIENAVQVELDGAGNFFPPLVNSLIIYANDNVHKAPESPPEVDDDPEEVGTSICLWGEGVTSEKGISKRNRSYRVKEAFSLKSRIMSRNDVCLEEANQSFGKNQMHKGACNKARKIWAIFLSPVRDSPTGDSPTNSK